MSRRTHVVTAVVVLYVALVLVVSFHFNVSLTPDRIVLLIAIAALATGRVRQFLKDWSIFLIILLAWQVLSGMSRHFGHLKPHVTEMIDLDRLLFFGHLPTLWLQHHFYTPGHLQWYDIGAAVLYMMHFALPMIFAFALWYWRRPVFLEFMVAFLILGLAGFATFVLYPAAPPWIAADWWHHFSHVYRIFGTATKVFGPHQSFSTLYQWMWKHTGWDLFGAVPSEHAAFPFLCFLYARRVWPRAGWLLLGYCACVWVAVVYLGEHYVTDVIVGVLYAALTYMLVTRVIAPGWSAAPDAERAVQVDRPRNETLPADVI
jgi:membrane-associated phospholipid phosphatase